MGNVDEPVIEEQLDEPIIDEPVDDKHVEAEADPLEPPTTDETVHPLKPGGVRFEQVYAQSKQSKRDLLVERERRVRAETLLEAALAGKQPATTTPEFQEYSWSELDKMITTGQITRADAEAHREEVITRKISGRLKSDLTRDTTIATRTNALTVGVNEYLAVLPTLTDVNSLERKKVDREFDWLASVQGVDTTNIDEPTRKALQLNALRNAFGSIESLTKRTSPSRVDPSEGLPGGTRPRPSNNPDQKLIDALTPREVEHYKKCFQNGNRYPNKWKDVVEELKFDPKRPVVDHTDRNKKK
jgi:hypothetical protein